jgi:uncharacterized protein (DUF1697 family)
MKTNYQYVVFLRGINLGGSNRIKMAELKESFQKMGFQNVRTVLATGNVIFESENNDKKLLTKEIESGLNKALNKDISVIMRKWDDIKNLQLMEPFKGIKVTPDIRFYVTFLPEKAESHTITIPYTSPQNEFKILQSTPMEIFSVLDLSKGKGTTELMNILQKEYGSRITTRNWNTVLKVLK